MNFKELDRGKEQLHEGIIPFQKWFDELPDKQLNILYEKVTREINRRVMCGDSSEKDRKKK
jgi:hypothetical protein